MTFFSRILCLLFLCLHLDCPVAPAQTSNTLNSKETDSSANIAFPFYSSFSSFTQLIDGAFAGVEVTHGGGQPGATGEIRMRGPNAFDNNYPPLIVMDGLPYFGNIAAININDIASVHLIKDATATMIYGHRAENGVIELTTRKGGTGNWQLTIDAKAGINQRAFKDYATITSEKDYYELNWESMRNGLVNNGMTMEDAANFAAANFVDHLFLGINAYDVLANELIDPLTGKLNPAAQLRYHDDLQKEIQRTAMHHDYNLSASKQGKAGGVYISANYLNEGGYIKHTGYERFSARINTNLNISSWLKGGLETFGSMGTQRVPISFSSPIYNLGPIYPVYYCNAAGEKERDSLTGKDRLFWGTPSLYNILGSLRMDDFRKKQKELRVAPYLDATFLKHFRFRSSFVAEYSGLNTRIAQAATPTGSPASLFTGKRREQYYTWNQQLSWERNLGQHHLKLQAGHEWFSIRYSNIEESQILANFPPGHSFTSAKLHQTIQGYFGRFDYNFKEKYFVYSGIRREQTSLWRQNKLKRSWAAGLGWDLSREVFLHQSKALDYLKFRAGYGTGALIHTASRGSKSTWDIGLDWSMYRGRFAGSLSYYNSQYDSTDIVVNRGAPSTGPIYLRYPLNFRNRGLELELHYTAITKDKFRWFMDLNLTHYRNRVSYVPSGVAPLGYLQLEEGSSLFDLLLPQAAGVNPENGRQLYYYADDQGRRQLTEDYTSVGGQSWIVAGSPYPDLFGSFTNTIRWRRIEFAFRVNFSLGGKIYDSHYQELMAASPALAWSADLYRRWTPENRYTDVPALNDLAFYNNAASDRFMTSASYLSIGRAMITYNFGSQQVARLKLDELSLYLAANNLTLFTARQGLQPQANFDGMAVFNLYGPARTVMFGLHLAL